MKITLLIPLLFYSLIAMGSGSRTLEGDSITSSNHATTITLPAVGGSDTATLNGFSQTLTNKTLTSPTINSGALSGTFSGTPTFSGSTTFSSSVSANSLTTTNPVAASYGGTGQSSYTVGDIPYASATNALSKLPIGTTNQVLSPVAGVPAWVTPVNVGAVMTDWVSYTPTFGAGWGAPTSQNIRSRRVGANLEVQGYMITGTTTAASSSMTLGYNGTNANVTTDTTLGTQVVGDGTLGTNATTLFRAHIFSTTGNTVTWSAQSSSATGVNNNPINVSAISSSGTGVSFYFSVPISGWTANSLVSVGGAVNSTVSRATASGTASGTGGFVSGTYTTPANVWRLKVKGIAGGGGGAGGSGTGVSGGAGGNGGNTTFGSSLLVANGGLGAPATSSVGNGGAGGIPSISSPAVVISSYPGGGGQAGLSEVLNTANIPGGIGGSSCAGGAGVSFTAAVGGTGGTNTGGGGSGGANITGSGQDTAGGGGGSGSCLEAYIYPTAGQTFSYSVGTGGTAGTAGTSGLAGGAGGSGVIEVTEDYFNGPIGSATSLTTSKITGVTDGSNAVAGQIGEYVSANPGSPVTPATSNTSAQLTSISLTAGDWDVYGTCSYTPGTGTATLMACGISLNSTSFDSLVLGGYVQINANPFSNAFYLQAIAPRRINITTTTTIYLVGEAIYSSLGTASWSVNNIIQARRIR